MNKKPQQNICLINTNVLSVTCKIQKHHIARNHDSQRLIKNPISRNGPNILNPQKKKNHFGGWGRKHTCQEYNT